MKFVQLIEYNKRDICLQKLCTKWDRKISSRPLLVFLKEIYDVFISKWSVA